LPMDLIVAFRATLEELENADLLLHIIDIANPRHMEQIHSVERILKDLNLSRIPQIRGLNKMDCVPPAIVDQCVARLNGIAICARDQRTLLPLIEKMAAVIETLSSFCQNT
jgi:GTP-binding protein HflX